MNNFNNFIYFNNHLISCNSMTFVYTYIVSWGIVSHAVIRHKPWGRIGLHITVIFTVHWQQRYHNTEHVVKLLISSTNLQYNFLGLWYYLMSQPSRWFHLFTFKHLMIIFYWKITKIFQKNNNEWIHAYQTEVDKSYCITIYIRVCIIIFKVK